MPLTEVAPTTVSGDFQVERLVGACHGIRVECWVAPEKGRAVLIASPTTTGFTVLAEGGLSDVAAMERTGAVVLAALAGVVPLINGEAFRSDRGIVRQATQDTRR